ncbi:MAG: hypothetical protein JNL90_04050 [Planctomycetes bacterium]|nr:hypothetical protein [Planctomycetota bacterium]
MSRPPDDASHDRSHGGAGRGSTPPRAADVDARLPPGVAAVVARGETLWLIDHPRALPPLGAPPADWVVVPLAFAWMYPDSLVVADALDFARRGLLLTGHLHGHHDPAAALRRLAALLDGLALALDPVHELHATALVVVARRRGSAP